MPKPIRAKPIRTKQINAKPIRTKLTCVRKKLNTIKTNRRKVQNNPAKICVEEEEGWEFQGNTFSQMRIETLWSENFNFFRDATTGHDGHKFCIFSSNFSMIADKSCFLGFKILETTSLGLLFFCSATKFFLTLISRFTFCNTPSRTFTNGKIVFDFRQIGQVLMSGNPPHCLQQTSCPHVKRSASKNLFPNSAQQMEHMFSSAIFFLRID